MLLEVESLFLSKGSLYLVEDLSFSLEKGETLGIVGESGSGKSLTCYALLDLLPPGIERSGTIRYQGTPIQQVQDKRGREITMIFQDPLQALNPLMKVGTQVAEMLVCHRRYSWKEAKEKAIAFFHELGIVEPVRVYGAYPHELSGGMAQRVVMAMALIAQPSLILADEPTTALDVTLQGEVLKRLQNAQQDQGFGMILVSHDLSVVSAVSHKVLVLYAGKKLEEGEKDALIHSPGHPYTRVLFTLHKMQRHPGETLPSLEGQVPGPDEKPTGCPFHPRCPYKRELCEEGPIPVQEGITRYWCIFSRQDLDEMEGR